ncbi:hypothetical protein TrVFT333_001770 [Trichoderma virens FT-333]|nr:hypothetical protein TrVFT333_001770 [Trichoderma virens FT-333]
MLDFNNAISIVRATYQVIEHASVVEDATNEKGQLCRQIEGLGATLEKLEKACIQCSDDNQDSYQHILDQLVPYMNDLKEKFKPDENSPRESMANIVWPRQKEYIEAALKKICELNSELGLRLAAQRASAEHEIDEIVKRLTPDLEKKLSAAPQQVQFITPGTCKEFWNTPEGGEWKNSEKGFLWISGIQGTGKTGLAVHIGDTLRKEAGNPPAFCVARLYCDYETMSLLEDHMDVVMSLWVQLVKYTPELVFDSALIKQWRADLSPGGFASYTDAIKLKMEVFVQTITLVGSVVLILDGLDEIPGQYQHDVVQRLMEIQERSNQCRLLITSRPYAKIKSLFEGKPRFNLEASDADINLYLHERVQRTQQILFKGLDMAEFVEDVIRELICKCNGSFLMAKLYMDEVLRATNETECWNIIRKFPRTASEAYSTGLKRLSEAAIQQTSNSLPCRAIQALFWVAYANRFLKEKQLIQALAVDLEDTDYDKEKEDLMGVDALCGELLIVDTESGMVSIGHRTVAEYLLKGETRQEWFPSIREYIPTILMKYLLLGCMMEPLADADSKDDFRTRHPLIPYAAKYWENTQLWKSTEEFLKAPFYRWNDVVKHEVAEMMLAKSLQAPRPLFPSVGGLERYGLTPGNINGVHWIVIFGLSAFTKTINDYETCFPVKNPIPATPLGLTILYNQPEIAKILLSQGAHVNLYGTNGRAQHLISQVLILYHERNELKSLLLDHGMDMTLRQPYNDKSLLDIAMDLLVEDGLTRVLGSNTEKWPKNAQLLHYLVRRGCVAQLKQAINQGLDVNLPCDNGKKALDYAYELGSKTMIDTLIQNNATPALQWPAVQSESSPYPVNFIETSLANSVITKQKYWGKRDAPVTANSYDDHSYDDHPYKGLLQVAIDDTVQLPIQKIVFETVSRNRAWKRFKGPGPYFGSKEARIEVRTHFEGGYSDSFEVQSSVYGSQEFRLHTNIWNLNDLEASFPLRANWMKNIQRGSILQVVTYMRILGFDCDVAFVRVRIYGS